MLNKRSVRCFATSTRRRETFPSLMKSRNGSKLNSILSNVSSRDGLRFTFHAAWHQRHHSVCLDAFIGFANLIFSQRGAGSMSGCCPRDVAWYDVKYVPTWLVYHSPRRDGRENKFSLSAIFLMPPLMLFALFRMKNVWSKFNAINIKYEMEKVLRNKLNGLILSTLA